MQHWDGLLSILSSGWRSKRSSTIAIHRRFFIVRHQQIRPIHLGPPSVIWSMMIWSSKWCPMDILLRLVFLTNEINLLYIILSYTYFSFFFFLLLLTFPCPYRESRGQVITVVLLLINQILFSLSPHIYIKICVFFFLWSLIVYESVNTSAKAGAAAATTTPTSTEDILFSDGNEIASWSRRSRHRRNTRYRQGHCRWIGCRRRPRLCHR